MKTRLQRFFVCDQCLSAGITDVNCVCMTERYNLIELEFDVCECCGNMVEDGTPADTFFNREQIDKLEGNGKVDISAT